MNDLVYPRERTLGTLTLVLGLLAWLGLIAGTFGIALLVLAAGFVLYLFLQSTLIAYIRGNGVELSAAQFPDLHAQFVECCERLQMKKLPEAYVLNGNGGLNAFATQFLGTRYVVLMSDVVDAMEAHADGVRFYIGHELGHLRMNHLRGHLFRWPVLWLPLLGAAYSRAQESTCDRHGLACSGSPEGAARALAALAAGAERWKQLDIPSFVRQSRFSAGFWMSFHELTAGYPWLTKRVARVVDNRAPMPTRSGLAYLFAAFVPYAGRLGAGFGVLMLVYVVGVLAAVALPAYRDYTVKAHAAAAISASQPSLEAITTHFESSRKVPDSLAAVGLSSALADGSEQSLDSKTMVLTVRTRDGEIRFTPSLDDEGHVQWSCSPGKGHKASQLPSGCQAEE